MDYKDELWRDVVGYEGLYMVSNYGRIKSLERDFYNPHGKGHTKGGIKLPHKDRYGYLRIGLNRNGTTRIMTIHRIVAKAFIENKNEFPCVNHKNEIKSDNRVCNLEWCTYRYNNHYGDRLLRISISSGEEVVQIDKAAKCEIGRYHSVREASRRTGIYHIDACCRGIRKTAGGYLWRYAKDECL